MSTKLNSVPLYDPEAVLSSAPGLDQKLESVFHQVLHEGCHVMGPEVKAFEEEWASYCGAKHCIAVSSGTDAIYLALMAYLELTGLFGRVIVYTTPFTFWATSQAILHTPCCIPGYYDVEEETGNVQPIDFEANLAVMVHMYGRPGHWSGSSIIEDMAHAHGHKLTGLMGCFSFYPTKNLGAIGQAGAVVTNNTALNDLIRSMREYGEKERFHYYHLTGNHRMDELQAAILRAKLPYLDRWNAQRREIALTYIDGLKEMEDLIFVPPDEPGHVYHVFAIKTPQRDDLSKFLSAHGIQTSVRYPVCCHQLPIPSLSQRISIQSNHKLLNAEKWAAENLTLPLYPGMEPGQIWQVIDVIKAWYQEASK